MLRATRSSGRGCRSTPAPSTRAATPATLSGGANRRARRRCRRLLLGTGPPRVPPVILGCRAHGCSSFSTRRSKHGGVSAFTLGVCSVLEFAPPGKVEIVNGLPDEVTACPLDTDVVRQFQQRGVQPPAVSRLGPPEARTAGPVPPGERGSGQRWGRR